MNGRLAAAGPFLRNLSVANVVFKSKLAARLRRIIKEK